MFSSDRKMGDFLRRLSHYTGLTMRPAAGVTAGFFGGRFLDGRWGTEPLLAVAGVLAGLFLGLFSLYREAVKDIQERKK